MDPRSVSRSIIQFPISSVFVLEGSLIYKFTTSLLTTTQLRYLQFISVAQNPLMNLICYEYHNRINPHFSDWVEVGVINILWSEF